MSLRPVRRFALGVFCAVTGIVPTQVMYANSEDGNYWNLKLFSLLATASVVSFIVWTVCRRTIRRGVVQIMSGILFCYAVLAVVLLAVSMLYGEFAETVMWLPVIVLFGIPYLAPLIGMAWCGAAIAFPYEKRLGREH